MQPNEPSKQLIDNFGSKIEHHLKSGKFSDYQSGNEVSFINHTVDLLDGKYAYDGQQILSVKCKKAHSSSMVTFNRLSSKYGKQHVELGDLLFVFNIWRGKSIIHRQAFISQSKCWKKKNPGHIYWEIDQSQFELLDKRPEFRLINSGASVDHDLTEANGSFYNYSFVSDVHRPFFYQTDDMDSFVDYNYATPRFYYGQNPPYGNRYLYAVLKNGLRRRYGSSFGSGDPEYILLEEIYKHASLNRSKSPNSAATYTDGGETQGEFGIINVDVDIGRNKENMDFPPNDERLSEDVEENIEGTIRDYFTEIDSDGLNFDSI